MWLERNLIPQAEISSTTHAQLLQKAYMVNNNNTYGKQLLHMPSLYSHTIVSLGYGFGSVRNETDPCLYISKLLLLLQEQFILADMEEAEGKHLLENNQGVI